MLPPTLSDGVLSVTTSASLSLSTHHTLLIAQNSPQSLILTGLFILSLPFPSLTSEHSSAFSSLTRSSITGSSSCFSRITPSSPRLRSLSPPDPPDQPARFAVFVPSSILPPTICLVSSIDADIFSSSSSAIRRTTHAVSPNSMGSSLWATHVHDKLPSFPPVQPRVQP